MSHWGMWLEMQRNTIEAGAACSKIVLEGPDGTSWATWPVSMKDLEQSMDGVLAGLREQLPRGNHALKFLALAGDGSQLSVFPYTVKGASSEATDGAQNQLTHQRATSLLISNFERGFASLERMLEHTAALTTKAVEGNQKLVEKLEQYEAESSKTRLEFMREEGKQLRLGELMKTVSPMLELAIGLASEYAADWLSQQESKRAGRKNLPPTSPEPPAATETASSLAPQVPESPHGEPRTPLSLEPPQSHHPDGDSSPGNARTNGARRPARNGGSDSRRGGNHKTSKSRR
jgi:hypothetical protein